jgi:hypothetical protein
VTMSPLLNSNSVADIAGGRPLLNVIMIHPKANLAKPTFSQCATGGTRIEKACARTLVHIASALGRALDWQAARGVEAALVQVDTSKEVSPSGASPRRRVMMSIESSC